jgi:NADH-quinone oxidoreductase subunit L
MSAGLLVGLGVLWPLAGFFICRFAGRRERDMVRVAGPGVIGISFLCFLAAAIVNATSAGDHLLYHWILPSSGAGPTLAVPGVDFDLYFDPLAAVMTLVVTGVGFLIHVYSVGYMDDETDDDYSRFFAHMNFFVFSMLLLVLAHNFVLLVIGWALVGLSSYLLIGFWVHRPAAVAAARKAFVMNVIGDVGIVIASFVALQAVGSLSFDRLFSAIPPVNCPSGCPSLLPMANAGTLELIGFLLIVGAVAKSAQIPLHTWLPDAMEGPTPVSALIHAATMVTAGVYLLARFAPLFAHAPAAATTAQWIGLGTALMAAVVATVQTDIKRVLAYSTMSQIGYMFFAVAAGAEVAGIFHLVTHAFFKALLFLAAGNVIHALAGEQDLRRMGGLWRSMPVTGFVFLIGALALAGIPPLAGFFSKDEIISAGFDIGAAHPFGGVVLVAIAGLTGYYMLRAFYLAFMAGVNDRAQRVHEPGYVMLVPVVALAALAAVGGLVQTGPWHLLSDYLGRVFGETGAVVEPAAALLTLVVVLLGFAVAYRRFGAGHVEERAPAVLTRAFFWDDLYQRAVVEPLWASGAWLYRYVEVPLVMGVADAAAGVAAAAGREARRVQTGYLRSYAMLFAAAALVAVVLIGWGLR